MTSTPIQPSQKTRRFFLDTSTRTLYKIIVSGGNILITGWLVKVLGQDDFGIFRGAYSSVGLISLASGGIGGAAYGLIVKYMAAQDYSNTRKVFSQAGRYMGMAALAVILCSLPLGYVLSFAYNIPAPFFGEFAFCAALSMMGIAFGFAASPFIWIMQAEQRDHVIQLFQLPLAVATPFLIYAATKTHTAAWVPCAVLALMALIGNMAGIAVSVWTHRRWLRYDASGSHPEIGKRTGYSFSEQFGAVVLAQALTWTVTFQLGLGILAQLAVSLTFYAFSRDLVQTLSSTLVAPVGMLYHRGELSRAATIWHDASIWTAAVACAVTCTICVMNKALISSWVGPALFAGAASNFWFAVSFFLAAINSVSLAVIYATDGFKQRALITMSEAVLTLVFAFGLSLLFGLPGAAAGACLAQFSSTVLLLVLLHQPIALPWQSYFFSLARVIVAGVVLSLLAVEVFKKIALPSSLLIILPVSAAVGGFLLLGEALLGISGQSRLQIWYRVRAMLSKSAPKSQAS